MRFLSTIAAATITTMIATAEIAMYVAMGASLVGGGATLGEIEGATVGGVVGATVGAGGVGVGVTTGAMDAAGASVTPMAVSEYDGQ